MFRRQNLVLLIFAALLMPGLSVGQGAAPAADPIAKFKDEGMNRSQVMSTIRYLTDVIGPRLTNSPSQRRANQWTKEQLEKWGMKNAAVDPWGEFGRGWELKRFNATVMVPEGNVPFRSYPKAWSPSTNGAITGDVIYVDATDEAGLEKYKGKLKGAIVFTAGERPILPGFQPTAVRQSDENLSNMAQATPTPAQTPQAPNEARMAEMRFNQRKYAFYFEEGAAVLVDSGFGVDAGTIRVMGASLPPMANAGGNRSQGMRIYSKDAPATIPQLVAEVEQYNRILRLLQQGVPVKMTVDLAAEFYDDDLTGYNTIAEIPGTDLADEVVMLGGHLDSWHSGTGATDNGAGVSVVMEAMRIIQASGLKPRRTIRVALWTGEEQGLWGSRKYVEKTFARVGDGSDAASFAALGGERPPLKPFPAYDKFSAYYNLDNGTGQIRGVYLQSNEGVREPFKSWLEPFREWDASTVTISNTSGTDHLAFDAVGLPGFQFIQDPIEYSTRTWHTTQDVVDRIVEQDLKRSAVIMAAFAYNTAMLNEKLPRKSLATASLLPGMNYRAALDEARFAKAGYGFSI
ncbi:MAG TPA: M20/M25/M40 family metallo-hydrolase, partial [Pyrinomonadaceae bacterium]|nr:M20/M25/M40 family metallo-hydrolase [Pyrinomonadaceae bacterium]